MHIYRILVLLLVCLMSRAYGQTVHTPPPKTKKPVPKETAADTDYTIIINARTGKSDTIRKNPPAATGTAQNKPGSGTAKTDKSDSPTDLPRGKTETINAKNYAGRESSPPRKEQGDNVSLRPETTGFIQQAVNIKNYRGVVVMVNDRKGMDNKIPMDASPVVIDRSILDIKRPERKKDTLIRIHAASPKVSPLLKNHTPAANEKISASNAHYLERLSLPPSEISLAAGVSPAHAAPQKALPENKTGRNTVPEAKRSELPVLSASSKPDERQRAATGKPAANDESARRKQPEKPVYPIIIDVPEGAPSIYNSGDFPRPYSSVDRRKQKPRTFISPEDLYVETDYNVPVTNPRLSIQIKLEQTEIKNIHDLKIYVTITNGSSRIQKFLFDRPIRPGFAMWNASCRITGTQHKNILASASKPEYTVTSMPSKKYNKYLFSIEGHEWFIRKFSVADIVMLNEQVCKNGRLPADTYSLQLVFQGNHSNTVTFTVR